MVRLFFLLFFGAFVFGAALRGQTLSHVPGEFLVSIKEAKDAEAVIRRLDPDAQAEKVSELLNVWVFRSNLPEQIVLKWLQRQPEIRFAQLNHLLENRNLPNDPLFPMQWHLLNDGSGGGVFDADLDAEQAWEITTGGITPAGDTIVVAVIDGGFDASHADLTQNFWRNWAEIPNNGVDDDQNGYKDDFRGWNTFSENDAVQGNSTEHGTPVSAILGARGNNSQGVTGVNWAIKTMRVVASGTELQILKAFDYILKARQRYNNSWGANGSFVVAVNCSWGINYGQPSDAPLWCEAFDLLGAEGIVSVAATANLPVNVDESGDLPTACPSNFLISVTSLNRADEKVQNAAWGKNHIDLGAYGQEVFTAAAGGSYGQFSGTSYAAPQVSGAIGLLFSAPCPNLIALAKIDPASSAYWAKSIVLESVTPNFSLLGKTFSDGRLNLYKMLQNYQNQCSNCPAPFSLKADFSTDTSALLTWIAPPSAKTVNLRWRRLGTGLWNHFGSVADTFLLSGLSSCTDYEFEVQAICAQGVSSAWSPPFIFQSGGCCKPPVSVWAANSDENSISLAWNPTSPNDTYRLRFRSLVNPNWVYLDASSSEFVLEDLAFCTSYQVQIQSKCEEWFTDFSAIFTFQTKGCGSCNELEYCTPSGMNANIEWIRTVQVGGWMHDSGPGGNGYQNFSTSQQSYPQLVSGTEVEISVTPGFLGSVSKEYFRVFVDFNQDGDFEDVGELAFDPGFPLEGTASGVIQIPELQHTGLTRMRVMMKYTTPNELPPLPCAPFVFGQVEDYCAELRLDSASTSIQPTDSVWVLRSYPQPARDWVMLEFPDWVSRGDIGVVSIVDMTARHLQLEKLPPLRGGSLFLDISQWPPGIYVVQVVYGGKTLRGKVVKN